MAMMLAIITVDVAGMTPTPLQSEPVSEPHDVLRGPSPAHRADCVSMMNNRAPSASHHAFQRFARWAEQEFRLSLPDLEGLRSQILLGRFPCFAFIFDLIVGGVEFDDADLEIMRTRLGLFHDEEEHSLEETAVTTKLDVSQIRDRASSIPIRLRELASRFYRFQGIMEYQPLALRERDIIVLDREYARYLNGREGLSCTPRFYAIGFEGLLETTHARVESSRHRGADYLIARDLVSLFSFDNLLARMEREISGRRSTDIELDLWQLVSTIARVDDDAMLVRGRAVCEALLVAEFDVRTDEFGRCRVARNTSVQFQELLVEVLREANAPLTIEELVQRVNAKKLWTPTDAVRVRQAISRRRYFRRFGNSKLYGLSDWDTTMVGKVEETFLDVAENYLRKASKPVHIEDLCEHVMRAKPVTRLMIETALEADNGSRFLMLPGAMVVLGDIDYDPVFNTYTNHPKPIHPTILKILRQHNGRLSLATLVSHLKRSHPMPDEQARDLIERGTRNGQYRIQSGIVLGARKGSS